MFIKYRKMQETFLKEIQQASDEEMEKEIAELEQRITALERYVKFQSCYQDEDKVETKQKPFWTEGGWMCNICFKFLHNEECQCKKK